MWNSRRAACPVLAAGGSASILIVLALLGGAAQAQDHLSRAQLAEIHARVTPAIGLVRFSSEITSAASGEVSKRDGHALGLVVRPDGLVMSHGHMVLENSHPFNITVTLGQGAQERQFDARVLRKPDDVNVVFLQLESPEPLDLPHVSFARDDGLDLASPVIIFGLLGEALDFAPALQEARISAVLTQPRTTYCLDDAVRFGYVGGPVVNMRGEVAGVVGFDLGRGEGGELYTRSGHPLVYQQSLFRNYVEQPPSELAVVPESDDAWLGVLTQPLTRDFADYWELGQQGGIIVSTVVPGSPAAAAGLRAGDILTRFGDTPIRARADRDVLAFTQLVRLAGAGTEVDLELLRDGEPQTLQVTIGARPRAARDAEEYEDPHFGFTVRELTTDVRMSLNLPEDVQGVLVRRVRGGSPAQAAQMRPMVIILRMGEHPIANLEDFRDAVRQLAEEQPVEIPIFARFGAATGFFRLLPRW